MFLHELFGLQPIRTTSVQNLYKIRTKCTPIRIKYARIQRPRIKYALIFRKMKAKPIKIAIRKIPSLSISPTNPIQRNLEGRSSM